MGILKPDLRQCISDHSLKLAACIHKIVAVLVIHAVVKTFTCVHVLRYLFSGMVFCCVKYETENCQLRHYQYQNT